MPNILREAFFEAIETYVHENKLGYVAAGARLGVPGWQMTRWFSKGSKSYSGWTNPRPRILEKIVFSGVEPISTIALTLLREAHAVPANFDFERACQVFNFNIGMPVALASALNGGATPLDTMRAAAFDLMSAFVTAQYLTELAAATLDGRRTLPLHPFGMAMLADPEDPSWPATIGTPLLDWNYSDENMHKQLSTVDEILEAGSQESNRLFNLLDKRLNIPKQAASICGDLSVSVVAATDAIKLSDITTDMARVIRDAADQYLVLAKSPLHRMASRIYEISLQAARHTEMIADNVLGQAREVFGDEGVDRLVNPPQQAKVVPLVKLSGSDFRATSTRNRVYATVLPNMPVGQAPGGNSHFFSTGCLPLPQSQQPEQSEAEESSDDWKHSWRRDG